jgi:hypothetical protein
LFAKAIDALNAKEPRTLLKAAVEGFKAVDANAAKKEGQNVQFFSHVKMFAPKSRNSVTRWHNSKRRSKRWNRKKMQADELATARERDTNLRVEALEFNPKAIRVFTSSDSYGTLVFLTDAILGGNRLWSGWMQISRKSLSRPKARGFQRNEASSANCHFRTA